MRGDCLSVLPSLWIGEYIQVLVSEVGKGEGRRSPGPSSVWQYPLNLCTHRYPPTHTHTHTRTPPPIVLHHSQCHNTHWLINLALFCTQCSLPSKACTCCFLCSHSKPLSLWQCLVLVSDAFWHLFYNYALLAVFLQVLSRGVCTVHII